MIRRHDATSRHDDATSQHHATTDPRIRTRTRGLAAAAAVAAVAGGVIVAGSGPAQAGGAPRGNSATPATSCPDVELVFARGSGEAPGLGMVGTPLASSLTSDLPGKAVEVYPVNYAASLDQSSAGPGATDMSNHIIALAAQCSATKFVIGGYSQGASVTDISSGLNTALGTGTTIPTALAPRIAAVVTFGNPFLWSFTTPSQASATYGNRWYDFCAPGDPICANGINFLAHFSYPTNGDTTLGAQYAASRVLSAS